MITLHDYTPADLEAVLTLFYETVHTVNAGDYSSAQLDAWAPRVPDRVAWQARLRRSVCCSLRRMMCF